MALRCLAVGPGRDRPSAHRNSGSHRQRLNNNQQQHALHGEPLSRSNSQQTQQQWQQLPLPGGHEQYYTPVQAQIASAGRRVPDQGSSQKSIIPVARKQKKRENRDRGNKPESQDDKEELIALKAKLAKLQSRVGTGAQRERKKPKIKVEGDDILPDLNPASGSSAPGPSSTLADETESRGMYHQMASALQT